MFIRYTQLGSIQKRMVDDKMAIRINAPKAVVKEVLKMINPLVKVIGKEVILMYDTLMRIEQEIKNIKR
ncbi:hypothetical protein [Aquimarina algiphila]|uniref:Uncharacterized protein n=1 Tax=Aquimarina algiphila TaxID=2047982 RepID=A0A554VBA2_9FLAO|nr:hypothetical protein [Aquimarina algiphila]TSE03740.1 hypothetical protein FOF46_28625 [Aquimarina algiphila]